MVRNESLVSAKSLPKGILLMTAPKGVVEVLPESTTKSRFFDSTESKNQYLPLSDKFCLDRKEEAKTGGGNTKQSWKECYAIIIA